MSVLSNRVLFYGIFEFPKEKRQMFWCFCLWGHIGHLLEVKRCFSKIVIWKKFINLPKIPKKILHPHIHTYMCNKTLCVHKRSVVLRYHLSPDAVPPPDFVVLPCLPACQSIFENNFCFRKKNNQPTYRPTTTKRKWLIIDFIRYRFRSTTTTKIQF